MLRSLSYTQLQRHFARTLRITHSRITAAPLRIRTSALPARSMSADAAAAPAMVADLTTPPSTADMRMDTTSPAAAATPTAAAGDSPTPAAAAAAAFPHYSAKLIDLGGWDTAVKVERKLLAAGIQFLGVAKKKGTRETTADVYFESEEQMREQTARMAEMREASKAAAPAAAAAAPAATAAAADATADATDAEAAAAAAAAAAPKGKFMFKVRNPTVTFHAAGYKRPADSATPGAATFNGERDFGSDRKQRGGGGKRQRTEGAEGFVAREGGEDAAAAAAAADAPTQHVNDVVAPLWRKPYPDQLDVKRAGVLQLMKDSTRRWRREYGPQVVLPFECLAEPDLPASKTKIFCPLEPILPSPVTEAYRNKCEFTIGYDTAGRLATGFLLGSFTAGEVRVEGVAEVPHVPQIAKALVEVFNEFATQCAADPTLNLKPYDKREHSGFFRLYSVRNSAESKQVMVLAQVDPKHCTPEQMSRFRTELIAHFRSRVLDCAAFREANEGYELVAVQLQQFSGVSNVAPEDTPVELLYGKEACIHEKLMGLDFRVSQGAFFQINVPQTARLYNVAAEFAKLPPIDAAPEVKAQHVLLDVCCGTGTIGLALSSRVGKVVGLEMSAAAIEDAKFNAQANGISNAHYYVGRAEDTLRQAIADHVGTGNTPAGVTAPIVTAIVDPPRSGLHADVLRLLRRNPRINRLVYVSCNAASMMDNLQRLVQPATKQYTGPAFVPVRAQPVDMFPHTTHCEMVVLLERESTTAQTAQQQQQQQQQQAKAGRQQIVIKQFSHQMKQEGQGEGEAKPAAEDAAAAAAAAQPAAAAEPTAVAAESAIKTESV